MSSRERGFSLVEMMFALALSTMVGYVLFVSSRVSNEQLDHRNVRMAIQDSAREGLYKMVQEIRQSAPSRITIGGSGNSVTFQVPDPSSLVNADYTLNWTSAQSISYALGGANNDQIIRTNNTTGLTAVIANHVTALNITGDVANPNVVTITMSVQRTLASGHTVPATPLQVSAQAEVRNS